MGRAHQAKIGLFDLAAADRAIGPGLDQAQQLDLQRVWDITYLVQEQRTAMGGLGQALAGVVGAGERAADVAKELALEQGFTEAGTLQGHQRAAGAPAGLVQCPGRQLLAGAGLAQQQHGGVAGSHSGDQSQHLVEGGTGTHHGPVTRHCPGHGYRLQQFDKESRRAILVQNGQHFHIDVLFSSGRLVNVQHPLPGSGVAGGRQRALLPHLVAGAIEVMGYRVAAGGALVGLDLPESLPIEIVGGEDAVVRGHQDGGVFIAVQHPCQGAVSIGGDDFHMCQL